MSFWDSDYTISTAENGYCKVATSSAYVEVGVRYLLITGTLPFGNDIAHVDSGISRGTPLF